MHNWARNMLMISSLVVLAFALRFAMVQFPYISELFNSLYKGINYMK
ncbi:hypothetical protein ACUXOD_003900 [Bacillus sp. 153480037-1]